MSNNQLRLFDGQAVDAVLGKVAGTFDVDDVDVREMALNDTVVIVMVASINAVNVKTLPNGDIQRINTLGAQQVRVAKGEVRDALLSRFDLDAAGQLELGEHDPAIPDEEGEQAAIGDGIETLTVGELDEDPAPQRVLQPPSGRRDRALDDFLAEASR